MATEQPQQRPKRPKSTPLTQFELQESPTRTPIFVSEILSQPANFAPKSLPESELGELASTKEHEDRKWFKLIFGLWFVVFVVIVVPIIILLVYILENMYQAKNDD